MTSLCTHLHFPRNTSANFITTTTPNSACLYPFLLALRWLTGIQTWGMDNYIYGFHYAIGRIGSKFGNGPWNCLGESGVMVLLGCINSLEKQRTDLVSHHWDKFRYSSVNSKKRWDQVQNSVWGKNRWADLDNSSGYVARWLMQQAHFHTIKKSIQVLLHKN